MINYEEASEALYLTRKSPVLVIYHGKKSGGELWQLDKLKGFHFLSDEFYFPEYLGGWTCSGLIIEPDVIIEDFNLRYTLTRLREKPEDLIFEMERAHKEQMLRILDGLTKVSANKYVPRMKEAMGLYTIPVNLEVGDQDESLY